MKGIKNITVNYNNTDSETITKGLVIDFSDSEDVNVRYSMCNNNGEDLQLIVTSVVMLAQQLGLLNEG